MDIDGNLFSTSEVAKRYGVSEDTVRSWIHGGELRAININAHGSPRPKYRIPKDSLVQFERQRTLNGSKRKKKPRLRAKVTEADVEALLMG